jgi:large subunit ribosomal protein L29
MNADKIRNLTEEELAHQERDLADQLFKLKFQLNMGQTESLKKIRGLRKDIARVKTIVGERGRATASVTTASATPAGAKAGVTKASATEKR